MLKNAHYLFVAALAGVSIAVVACSDEHSDDDDGHNMHSHGNAPAECQAIIDACHEKDTGDPGPVNDCHAIGHALKKDDCIAAAMGDFGGSTCPQVCHDAPMPDGGGHAGTHGGHMGGMAGMHSGGAAGSAGSHSMGGMHGG